MTEPLCTLAEFCIFGLRRDAWAELITQAEIEEILVAATDVAYSYLVRRGYPLPIAPDQIDPSLKRAVAKIAKWDALQLRGVDPSQAGNFGPENEAKAAVEWLEKIAAGEINLPGLAVPGVGANGRARAPINLAMAIGGDAEERWPSERRGPPRGGCW